MCDFINTKPNKGRSERSALTSSLLKTELCSLVPCIKITNIRDLIINNTTSYFKANPLRKFMNVLLEKNHQRKNETVDGDAHPHLEFHEGCLLSGRPSSCSLLKEIWYENNNLIFNLKGYKRNDSPRPCLGGRHPWP